VEILIRISKARLERPVDKSYTCKGISTFILKIVRHSILFLSLFYVTLYLPFSLILYLPGWYKISCNWHSRCEKMGYERIDTGIKELSRFFRHQGELTSIFWTGKEKAHLLEVRHMADKMFFFSIFALCGLIFCFHARLVSDFALVNMIIILSLLTILPVFGVFWRDVFHPILFKNQLWLNTRFDFSFYIMPRVFFKITTALLIVICSGINFLIWYGLRKRLLKL